MLAKIIYQEERDRDAKKSELYNKDADNRSWKICKDSQNMDRTYIQRRQDYKTDRPFKNFRVQKQFRDIFQREKGGNIFSKYDLEQTKLTFSYLFLLDFILLPIVNAFYLRCSLIIRQHKHFLLLQRLKSEENEFDKKLISQYSLQM